MNKVVEFPKYKEDVYMCARSTSQATTEGSTWGEDRARKYGYKYYTYSDYQHELYVVFPTHREALHGRKGFVPYPDLPSKKDKVMTTTTFRDKVLEFVLDPARSNSNQLMRALTDKNFFNSAEEYQHKIINELLANSDFCGPGKDKFRKHMGDMLTTFIIEVTSDYFEAEFGNDIAIDIKTALKVQWGKDTNLGRLDIKFVEVKEK